MGRSGILGLTALLARLTLSAVATGYAGDSLPGEASAPARLSTLRARLVEWYEARKNLVPVKCPKCAGYGLLDGGRAGYVTCPRCDGRKAVLSPTAFRKVTYDMRTETWRARPHGQEAANAAYKEADGEARPPGFVKSFRVDRVELVGDRFGLGFVFEGTDSVSRESRWVRGLDPSSKKETWFVHSPETDGAFAVETVPAGTPVPTRIPVAPERLDELRKRLALADVEHDLEEAVVEGDLLELRLFSKKPTSEEELDRVVAADTVPAVRTALAVDERVARVGLVFLSRWRDRFGAVGRVPFATAGILRADFDRIVFGNLTPGEVFRLFDPRRAPEPVDGVRWWKD